MNKPNEEYLDEEITKKMCLHCNGEGFVTVERGTIYRGEPCKFCRGTGRVLMSGTYAAVTGVKCST